MSNSTNETNQSIVDQAANQSQTAYSFDGKSLSEVITDFKDAKEISSVTSADFAKICDNVVRNFIGNYKKQWEIVSKPAAYAFASCVLFHDNNNIGSLWYNLLDPVNNMGNKTMAAALQGIAYDVFGVDLRLKKAETVKEGQAPYTCKNRKADPDKGILAPKDMNRDDMINAIKLLDNGGFKELVNSMRIAREKAKEENKGDTTKPLTRSQLLANPNTKKAIDLADLLVSMQNASSLGMSDVRIRKLVNELDAILIDAVKLEGEILDELVKSQAKGINENKRFDKQAANN